MTTHTILLSPTHAANVLFVHRRTLDRLVRAGRLHRDPATQRFNQQDILRLREERYQQKREALIQRIRADVDAQVTQAHQRS